MNNNRYRSRIGHQTSLGNITYEAVDTSIPTPFLKVETSALTYFTNKYFHNNYI